LPGGGVPDGIAKPSKQKGEGSRKGPGKGSNGAWKEEGGEGGTGRRKKKKKEGCRRRGGGGGKTQGQTRREWVQNGKRESPSSGIAKKHWGLLKEVPIRKEKKKKGIHKKKRTMELARKVEKRGRGVCKVMRSEGTSAGERKKKRGVRPKIVTEGRITGGGVPHTQ